MITKKIIIGLLLTHSIVLIYGSNNSDDLHAWQVHTMAFKSTILADNPYAEMPIIKGQDFLSVKFIGLSGKAEGYEFEVVGFWNGGNEWQVNVAFPMSGSWTYLSKSKDPDLDGLKGMLEVGEWNEDEKKSNPTRRGPVQVKMDGIRAGHIFEYNDGTPFLWIADTWWNWTKRSIHLDTFKKLVDDRASKGFTLGQLFVAGNGWSQESSLLDISYSIPDMDLLNRVEQMIQYANSMGITVWIHGWWSRKDMNLSISQESIRRWIRYLVHRYAAYNVVWVIAGEYNMYNYGGFGLDFWKEVGQFLKDEDPYGHIISAHNTPPFWGGGKDAPQWSTGSVLHDERWLDYNQCQTGHGRYANEMAPSIVLDDHNRIPAKPIVVTEPWYEFVEGDPGGKDIRFAAWSSMLSGAAGHTYGGGHVWRAHVPESPEKQSNWPLELSFDRNTHKYVGAVSMGILSRAFKNIEWWKMVPHPELIIDYPQPFCLAIPGEEYLVYLRYAGSFLIDLTSTAPYSKFEYQWLNPETGHFDEPKIIEGGNISQFVCPEASFISAFRDWVLHIKKID